MSDYTSVGELLADLTGHGVYDVAIIDEFKPFGFAYDLKTDRVTYEGASVVLGSGTPEQVRRSMESDPKGGILDEVVAGSRLVDAVALAEAIFNLIAPGQTSPGAMFYGRARRYRATVDAIRGIEDAVANPFKN